MQSRMRDVRDLAVLACLFVGVSLSACSGSITSNATDATAQSTAANGNATNANNQLGAVSTSATGNFGQNGNGCAVFANSNQLGTACTGSFGAGVNICVNASLVCEPCAPGATRTTPCACGTNKVDVCSDNYIWLPGTCSLCPPIDNCRSGDGCTPGTTETRRCDTCTGANCTGTTAVNCVGSKWKCSAACVWEQTAACAALSPECTQDVTQSEACGWCGTQAMTCDGCFWLPGPCTGQGVCPAGNTQTIPCSAVNSTASASTCPTQTQTSTVTCDSTCKWAAPTGCSCTVGATRTTSVSCPTGQCGSASQNQVCVAVNTQVCGNTETLASTTWQNTSDPAVTTNCSTTCGGGGASGGGGCTTCVPGDTRTQTCTSTCSLPGNQTQTCSSDGCGWANSGSCVPQDSTKCISGTVVTHEACAAGHCSRSADPTHHLTTCQNNCIPLDQPCVACN